MHVVERRQVKRIVLSIVLAVSLPRLAAAQTSFDRFTPALPTEGERRVAEIASWATLLTAVALDARATIGKCDGQDQCYRAVVMTGLRVGVTLGATALVKKLVHRTRPCAKGFSDAAGYDSACGIDDPDASFYSGHTALAFSTLGGPRLAFALPLSVGTGGLRVAAGKHWLTDVLVGAGVGALTSRIR
ncbi:MAG: hypothetical protein RLZZ200_2398 [Pseudomonadota bacterium]|jgi:membrane-associated phospholipid phosphatase